MHTDRKIGFAMGILLIGIVAALFFRNEPLLNHDIPTVRRERELNERLRERDVAVYLNDSKDKSTDDVDAKDDQLFNQPLREILKNMDERKKSLPSPVGSSRDSSTIKRGDFEESSLDGYRSVKDGPDDDVNDGGRIADLLKPAKQDPEPGKLPPLFPPTEPQPSETAATPAVPETPAFSIPEHFEEYVVKYGDTLSGIAQKMLGSQSRYQEIYEANRDRMASPDRLDVGKPIRIPRTAGELPKTY